MIERLEPLVGEWSVEAVFPGERGGDDDDARATTTFGWALDGSFLIQRARVPHPMAPDSLALIGVDPRSGGFLQHYFDSRGVVRLYAMTFEDGLWTLLREEADFSPLPFKQRFSGRFSADGRRIDGRWERTGDDGEWEIDFALMYTRVAE